MRARDIVGAGTIRMSDSAQLCPDRNLVGHRDCVRCRAEAAAKGGS